MKRILIGGMNHESNTFSPIITGEDDFTVYHKEEIFNNLGHYDVARGIVEALQNYGGYEIIPTLFARAVPNGVIDFNFYTNIKEELLKYARKAGVVDGIILGLHGSMRVQKIGEAEGDLIRNLREIFPDTPLHCALDMHATLSRTMFEGADSFVGYKEAPHTDVYETGVHAVRIMHESFVSGKRPRYAVFKVPMIIAGEQSETSTEPMKSLMARCREMETREDVLAASILLGFPWADTSDNGVHTVVVTKDDRESARNLSEELAVEFWRRRREFTFHTETYSPEEAVIQALAAPEKPVYLSDSGDNPTAGGTADNPALLKILIEHPQTFSLAAPAVFAGIYDPDAVASCRHHIGEERKITLGGKLDKHFAKPLPITVKIKELIPEWGLYKSDLLLVESGNVEIIVTSKHIGFISPDMMEAFGISPGKRELVVVKLGYLTDSHKKIAGRSIMALSPGCTNEDLATLDYCALKHPVFPLDPKTEWKREEALVCSS